MNYHPRRELLPQTSEPTTAAELHHLSVDDLQLDVLVADARREPSDETILFFPSWSEYAARPDASDRYRLLATTMGARIVALDNLGMGPNSSKLPPSMRSDIERGDLSGNVQVQLEALQQLSIPLARASLMGFSLGTSMAARFARSLEGRGTVGSLTLAEPVGTSQQSTISLMRKFAVEMASWGRGYRARRHDHPQWMHTTGADFTTIRMFTTDMRQYMAYPQGLSTAPLMNDLSEAYERTIFHDTPIRVVNGGASTISTTAENEAFVERLQALGFDDVTHDVYEGISHGVIDDPRTIIPMLVGNHFSER